MTVSKLDSEETINVGLLSFIDSFDLVLVISTSIEIVFSPGIPNYPRAAGRIEWVRGAVPGWNTKLWRLYADGKDTK